MKNITTIIFLMMTTLNIKAQEITTETTEKLGLMPYAALTRTNSSAEIAGEEEAATGYEAGVEYEWLKKGLWSSGSRLTLKNLNTDAGVMGLFSYEMEMNILSIGQSITYDVDLGGSILKPFATIDVGMGLAKSRAEIFGETFESDAQTMPYANASLGARYVIGEFVPFVAAGYQYAKADIEQASEAFSTSAEIDYSGTYFTVGLGMVF
jgi:hypothetical protein